jgi:nitrogen fixation protein NifX
MTTAPIPDDMALRIGLAARSLPDTPPGRLIRVLADAIGLPPTAEKLAALKVKDLKQAAEGELGDVDPDALKAALALLKGEGVAAIDPPPPLEPAPPGDMPGSIRVACASNGGEALDGHFGSARRFLVYQVSAEAVRLIDARDTDDSTAEDKNAYRAGLIRDCQVLYVASIGGPAAAKVVKADIHPIKDAGGGSARDRVSALQRILADKPPPWLAKVMGQDPEARVRFERDASGAGAEA